MASVEELDAVKAEFAGKVFDVSTFHIDAEHLANWAIACGETDARFVDPAHPDFQAHPGYTSHFSAGRWRPKNFPELGNGRGMDGGKCVEVFGPIRAGDTLTAETMIADMYAKTGRSGTMIFIVNRMSFVNQDGEQVASVDWRQIQQTD